MEMLRRSAQRARRAELTRTMASFRSLSARLDSTLANPALARTLGRADTLTGNLAAMTAQLTRTGARLDTVLAGVNSGRGTIGKFATDSGLLLRHPGAVAVDEAAAGRAAEASGQGAGDGEDLLGRKGGKAEGGKAERRKSGAGAAPPPDHPERSRGIRVAVPRTRRCHATVEYG